MASQPRPCRHCAALTRFEEEPIGPFCSERCRDLDMAGWLDGKYSLPGRDGEAQLSEAEIEEYE